jgi:predicted amidohydrolase YtcJ
VLRDTGDLGFHLGPDLALHTGVRCFSIDDGRRIVEAACDAGFSVAIHAIGNGAVEQAIDALGRARAKHRDSPPPRIEHASIIDADAARRAADLGIAVAAQPHFITLPVFDEMPRPPGLRFLAHRTLIDAGVRVGGSSDAPVTAFEPLAAMGSAVTRRTRSGAKLHEEEALSAHEALALYTREAAYIDGSLDIAGTLEPGKRADIVVLSADPCGRGEDTFADVRVDRTILGGQTVFARA